MSGRHCSANSLAKIKVGGFERERGRGSKIEQFDC